LSESKPFPLSFDCVEEQAHGQAKSDWAVAGLSRVPLHAQTYGCIVGEDNNSRLVGCGILAFSFGEYGAKGALLTGPCPEPSQTHQQKHDCRAAN
jgi:hypothetical protein